MRCMTDIQTTPPFAVVPAWTTGDRLRKAREEADIGVAEMATLLGRSRNSIGRYERLHIVDELVIRAYAMETGVSYRWLLTGNSPEGGDPITNRVTHWKLIDRRGDNRTCRTLHITKAA